MSYSVASSTSKRPYSTATATSASSFSSVKGNRTGRRWFPIACNKCQKPIDSTVFICSCKCLFCEDCTHSHFRSSKNCPQCGRQLGGNDFSEIMVSDSSNKLASNPNELLQSLLTKTSSQSRELSWDDMGRALLREQDAILANTMVFVKQFVRETQRTIQEGRIAKNQAQAYRKQVVALEKHITGLRGQEQDYKERLHKKDLEIQRLKNMLAHSTSDNRSHISHRSRHGEPERQSNSGFVPTTIGIPNSSMPSRPAHGVRRQGSSGSFPTQKSSGAFHSYIRKKEKGEMVQERNLMNAKRKKNNPMVTM